MKKALILMLAMAMVLTMFVGCSNGGAVNTGGGEGEAVKVGYSCNNLNDTFQTYIVDAAKEAAKEANITLDVQDAQEDVIKQQDQVNTLIEQGVKALIVVPVDTSATDAITTAAAEAGIPLVYVNRNPFGDSQPPENVYYIGTKEVDAGKFQAEYLKKIMPEGGGIAILQGILSNEAALKRTQGNEEVLAGGKFTILAKESGNWQRDQGINLTENWITAYGDDLKVVLGNNDEMALGAVQALQAAGRTDVIVMGVDATPDGKAAVADGTMACTVLQDPVAFGSGAVNIITKALADETVDAVTWLPFTLITADNVKDFM